MEVKTKHSFWGCGCIERLSSASHRAGWADAADAQDPPLFLVSGTSHVLGGEKADVLSPPLINPGAGFKPSVRPSPMT
jgi:hypothetical protein